MTRIHMLDDGFSDLSSDLPYRHFIAPGVLLLDDDDAMMSIIEYSGRDQSVLSDEDIDSTSARVANLLTPLGVGNYVLHCEVEKRLTSGYPDGSDAYPVSALLDAKRRQRMNIRGNQYRLRTRLGITYTPPSVKARRLHRFFFRSPEEQTQKYYAEHVEPFRELVSTLARHLNSTLGYARLLNDDEVVTAIHNAIDPQGCEYVQAPTLPGFPVKYAVGTLGMIPGKPTWRTNGHPDEEYFVRVFGVSGYPTVSDPSIFAVLQEADTEFRLNYRFECLSEAKAESVLKWIFRTHDETALDWRSYADRVAGLGDLRNDPVGVMKAMDAEAARIEAVEPGVVTGFLSVTGVAWGRSQKAANDAYGIIQKTIKKFTIKDEGWNSELAYLGSLYGNTRANARRVPLPSTVMSDMILLTSPWTGAEPNRHLGYEALMRLDSPGGAGVNLDLFEGKDGFGILAGPPRVGKSTAEAHMGHQWLARIEATNPADRPRVIWVDADSRLSTSMIATWMAGGEFISFESGDMALQPLARVDEEDGKRWCKHFMSEIWTRLGMPDASMPEDRLSSLTEDALDILARSPVSERTLSGLADVIQSTRLRNALRSHYTKGSTLGHLLDANHDRIQDADWITIDLTKLTDGEKKNAGDAGKGKDTAIVLMALFRRIYDLIDDARPTLFLVDEFRQMAAIHEEIDEIRRRGPKRRVCLVLAAHRVDDLYGSSIFPILKTAKASLYFGDTTAPDSTILTEHFGVTPTERQRIGEAGRRGDPGWLLYKTLKGSRVCQIKLTDLEKAICGCGADEKSAAMEIYRTVGRGDFPVAWLEHKGLYDEAADLRARTGVEKYAQAAE
jgi:type IV secretion system protein VirB4